MPFDINTAKPVKQGFDINTAKPVIEQKPKDNVTKMAEHFAKPENRLAGLGYKAFMKLPFVKRGVSAATKQPISEVNLMSEAILPKPQGLGEKLFESGLSVAPDIAAMHALPLKALGATKVLSRVPGFVKSGLNLGAYQGAKALTTGDNPIQAAPRGMAMGSAGHLTGRLGASLVPETVPFAERIGGTIAQGISGAVTNPQDPVTGAVLGAGLEALTPSQRFGGSGAGAKKLSQKATDIYRNILRPMKGDIRDVEIRAGKNLDDYYKLAAEEGLQIETMAEGKIDTTKARGIIEFKQRQAESMLSDELKQLSQSGPETKWFDLEDLRSKAIKDARANIKSDTSFKDATEDINKYIDDAVEARGQYVKADNLNDFKQGMWSMGYNQMRPTAKDSARVVGRVAKEAINEAFPDSTIANINKRIGDYATLDKLLERAHGSVVSGGRIGKYVAQVTGATIGAGAGNVIPGAGTLAGGMAGRWAGGKLYETLHKPSRLSQIATKKMQKAMNYPASMRRRMEIEQGIKQLPYEVSDRFIPKMIEKR